MENNPEEKFQSDKNFDPYHHMKCNIKCTNKICEIHDSILNYYCFYCKRSICEVCKETFHAEHMFMPKSNVGLRQNLISKLFNELEETITNTSAFSNPDKLVKDIKENIVKEFDEMHNKLNELKDKRIQEVYKTFNNSNEDALKLINNIKSTKSNLSDFFLKNSKFLEGENVLDDDNFIFIQLYDIFNSVYSKSVEYLELINNLNLYYSDNDLRTKNKYKYILDSIEQGLVEQIKNQTILENIQISGEEDDPKPSVNRRKSIKEHLDEVFKDNHEVVLDEKEAIKKYIVNHRYVLKINGYDFVYDKLKKIDDFCQNFKKSVYESFNKHGSLVEVEKLVKLYEEKTVKRMNYLQQSQGIFNSKTKASMKGSKAGLTRSKLNIQTIQKDKDKKDDKEKEDKTQLVSPKKEKERKSTLVNANMFSLQEIDDEYDDENQKKIEEDKSDDSLDSLFNNSDENKIGINFEKNIKENNKVMKKLNNMFRPKPKLNFSKQRVENQKFEKEVGQNDEEKFKVNAKLLELIRENQQLTSMIKKQDDINLAITTIRRYFTFCLLDYTKNATENQKSGFSTNMIETSSLKDNIIEDQVKVVEGTNELIIYNREKMSIKKIKVIFDKKKLSCSYFLPGCRVYKSQEKVFISGGKDINGDRKLFLAYNIKENKLIKLPDMCNARSYHTSIFHESLKSLVVFGGENNSTCEMYDFYLNMWNTIPDLIIPRANAGVYIDKVGTFAYVISGIIGSITSNNYCDTLEFLDLVDMNQGWIKIDFKNKANVDLKNNETKIFPLTDNKLLIYGANESRNINKCFVTLDLKTFDLEKIDNEELEQIKVKAKLFPEDQVLGLNS